MGAVFVGTTTGAEVEVELSGADGPTTPSADCDGTVVPGPGATGFAQTPPEDVPPLGSVNGPHGKHFCFPGFAAFHACD